MTSSKPALLALKTPTSGTLPSELPRSPYPGTPSLVKAEDGFKTPITPPTAYMDFLKAVTSPVGVGVGVSVSVEAIKSGKSTPTSAPSSDSSACSCQCENHSSSKASLPPPPTTSSSSTSSSSSPEPGPASASASAQPQSAPATASLRRLLIPASPLHSPAATESPISAFSIRSPFNVRSPLDWELDAGKRWSLDRPKSGGVPRPVSVRQVITRTVTYKPRMDLAPAPKGKKRRLE